VVHDRGVKLLATPAEIRCEERLHNGVEGAAVLGSAEAVPFIRVVDVDHRDAVLLHRGDDLLGLRSFHAHVVRALADQ